MSDVKGIVNKILEGKSVRYTILESAISADVKQKVKDYLESDVANVILSKFGEHRGSWGVEVFSNFYDTDCYLTVAFRDWGDWEGSEDCEHLSTGSHKKVQSLLQSIEKQFKDIHFSYSDSEDGWLNIQGCLPCDKIKVE